MLTEELKNTIRQVPDFPKKGIQFLDITTGVKNPEALKDMIDFLYEQFKDKKVDYVAGIESRGFKLLTHKPGLGIHNELMSSVFISFAVAYGFFFAIRYSLRRYDNMKRWESFKHASYTAIYMLVIWFPMVLYICGKILFKKKDMRWGKTTHGLIREEEQKVNEQLLKS